MKSHTKHYLSVLLAVYEDTCRKSSTEISRRDKKYIRLRLEKEGLSFLTITLPSFASDLEQCLEQRRIGSEYFRSFRKYRSIPAFMQGMVSQLFDVETGRITNEESPQFPIVLEGIRQTCLFFKKIELPCTPEREKKALDAFIDIERSFDDFQVSEDDREKFSLYSSMLWDNLLGDLRLVDIVPRHGPGTTADKRLGNQKFVWQRWHSRLEPYFPLLDSCYPFSIGELDDQDEELRSVSVVSDELEQPVKVVLVPKTLKTPRVIAIEPCCMQYTQQGLRDRLYSVIQSYWLTKGHINFSDQSINQSLALDASADGRLATIDLSEASDRVPLELALEMFQSNPDIRDAIDACRSKSARLPDGLQIPLRKFASMGSALCFPVEAMYFYTLCVMAINEAMHLPVSRRGLFLASRDIYVYGDDILVPVAQVETVLRYLEKYNCKVNSRKTFWNGSFRESCGMDAYKGKRVTPVYFRRPLPENRQQANEILSCVSTARQLFKAGLYTSAEYLFSHIEVLLGDLPQVSDESPALGRVVRVGAPLLKRRWNADTQQVEVLAWVPSPVFRTDKIEGHAALTKSLLRLGGLTTPLSFWGTLQKGTHTPILDFLSSIVDGDVRHLERSARYGVVAIKRRWVPATLTGIAA